MSKTWYPPLYRRGGRAAAKWHRASPIQGDQQRAFCNFNLYLDLEEPIDGDELHEDRRCKRCCTGDWQ